MMHAIKYIFDIFKRIQGHYGGEYYVTPPQGLRNIIRLHRGPNNRNVTHHSVLTIDDDITLIAKNYGGDCDWFTERSCDLPKIYGGVSNWFSE